MYFNYNDYTDPAKIPVVDSFPYVKFSQNTADANYWEPISPLKSDHKIIISRPVVSANISDGSKRHGFE